MTASGCAVTFWDEKNGLELERGDGSTNLRIY